MGEKGRKGRDGEREGQGDIWRGLNDKNRDHFGESKRENEGP